VKKYFLPGQEAFSPVSIALDTWLAGELATPSVKILRHKGRIGAKRASPITGIACTYRWLDRVMSRLPARCRFVPSQPCVRRISKKNDFLAGAEAFSPVRMGQKKNNLVRMAREFRYYMETQSPEFSKFEKFVDHSRAPFETWLLPGLAWMESGTGRDVSGLIDPPTASMLMQSQLTGHEQRMSVRFASREGTGRTDC